MYLQVSQVGVGYVLLNCVLLLFREHQCSVGSHYGLGEGGGREGEGGREDGKVVREGEGGRRKQVNKLLQLQGASTACTAILSTHRIQWIWPTC